MTNLLPNVYVDQYPVTLANLDGISNNIGRVVIYHSGQWGTICRTGLSNQIYNLLCIQAGFLSGGSLYNGLLHRIHSFIVLND